MFYACPDLRGKYVYLFDGFDIKSVWMNKSIQFTLFPNFHLSVVISFLSALNSFTHVMNSIYVPTKMPKPSSINRFKIRTFYVFRFTDNV